MSPRLAAKVGLIGFACFLVVLFPARVAWHFVGPAVPDVRLSEIDGSVWRGRAETLIVRGNALGSLSWSWRPLAFLRGRFGYAAALEDVDRAISGDIGICYDGAIAATEVTGRALLANTASRFMPKGMRFPPELDGRLDLSLREIKLHGRELLNLDGRILAADLKIGERELGTLDVLVSNLDGGVAATLASEGDPSPGIEGEAFVSPSMEYRLDISFVEPSRLGQDIDTFVRGFGVPGENGSWRINWQGQL